MRYAPEQKQETRARVLEGQALAGLSGQMGHPASLEAASSLLSELVGAVCMARIELDAERSELILERARRAVLGRFGLATPS